MELNRRNFVLSLGAAGFYPAFCRAGSGEPLLKIGIMTDTHVGNSKASCARARLAYELFRDIGTDMIANVGDVADHHYPDGYAGYREMVEETFAGVPAGSRPEELFVYAWHDAFAYKGHKRSAAMRDAPKAFADMQRLIKAPNGLYAEGEIKGFPYVVIPQFHGPDGVDWDRFDAMMSNAVKSHPGKPVFVFAHVPPSGTTRSQKGMDRKREVLNRYPQAINISGHTHGSLRDERAIWQGEFTSVNIGCLQTWGGSLPGSNPKRNENYGVVLLEVYPDRAVFRRFDVRDRKEYAADNPWTVPLPFDPATAPYRRETMIANARVPQFAKDAALTITPDGADSFKSVDVAFPCAATARAFAYRIEALRGEDGKWIPFARKDMYGDFFLRERDRPAACSQVFQSAYFEKGREYRIRAVPRNCWGTEGAGLENSFVAPQPESEGKIVWESLDPMNECTFLRGGAGNKKIGTKDGFLELGEGKAAAARLEFPDGVWKGRKGSRFRLVYELRTIQEKSPCFTLTVRDCERGLYGCLRIPTLAGDSGMQRYVQEFTKSNAAAVYSMLIREGVSARMRFGYIRLEKLS